MVKDLVNMKDEEIEESSKQVLKEIEQGIFCSDKTDYYANKILKVKSNDSCRLGHKGPFLLIEDVSQDYASALENKAYYRCICLECGRLDDYQLSRSERNLLVKIDDFDYSIYSIDKIRRKYFELANGGMSKEEAVTIINDMYKNKDKKLNKVKKQ